MTLEKNKSCAHNLKKNKAFAAFQEKKRGRVCFLAFSLDLSQRRWNLSVQPKGWRSLSEFRTTSTCGSLKISSSPNYCHERFARDFFCCGLKGLATLKTQRNGKYFVFYSQWDKKENFILVCLLYSACVARFPHLAESFQVWAAFAQSARFVLFFFAPSTCSCSIRSCQTCAQSFVAVLRFASLKDVHLLSRLNISSILGSFMVWVTAPVSWNGREWISWRCSASSGRASEGNWITTRSFCTNHRPPRSPVL